MRKKIPFLLCIVLLPLITFGQSKKSLDEAALFSWKSIENRQISDDGKWLTYQLMPNKGDGNLIIMNTRTREEITIERGKQVYIDHHLEKLSCLVSPEETLIDSLKRMKKKEDELPIDTLLILDLKTGEKQLIPNVKSLKTPIKWDGFIIYQLDSDRDTFLEKVLPRKMKKDESVFIIHHLENDQEDTLTYVQALILAEEESVVYFHQNASDSTKLTYIKQLLLPDYDLHEVFSDKGTVSNLGTSRDGKQVTWLFDKDTSHHIIPEYDLYSREMPNEASKIVAEKERKDFIPDNWMISDNFQATYSPDGNRLFFGMAPIPLMPDTTLLPDEIVEVEIWNYQDELLYTQQKVQEKKEKKRTYLACFDFAEHNLVPLGNEETQTIIKHDKLELEWAIGLEDQSMQKYLSWEGRTYKDLFLVSLLDGSKELVAKRISGDPEWSPGGKYIYWYEEPDTAWYAYSLEFEKLLTLTHGKEFSDELNDLPDFPRSYGLAGWNQGDERIYLYDRYDIWEINPFSLKDSKRITQGREKHIQYRYVKLDMEEEFLPSGWLVRTFNELDKSEAYVRLNTQTLSEETLTAGNFQLDRHPLKAKDVNYIIFTQETFLEFPDLWLAVNDQFSKAKKLSNANPQQKEYLWGNIELVHWTKPNGERLEGLLVKPENFDPSKKYPMIVNFYERSSDGLHNHRAPFPHRSTINYTFYASNGYIIFNPDVTYEVGYPGKSALDAVVSGTEAILKMGFVDPEKVGLQGHSWGGYQIAHIVTKTDMFACAESGAPVVNMVSAYGGIRWGSGMSRMFQYEHTQSRLGATLWENPELYLENSPIFNVDKIHTPVLILHNDHDSAVPWYQGIEFFVAMRRLNKPAWLLNYNDEPHWPLKWQNRLDFNRRLFQFFNYYLKGEGMPVWMKTGVPAIEKGMNSGLELSQEK